ncbi:TlpA family protein disulfide reductase [Clostridium sp. FP2]|uniref:TlpA family protein disulfide reductase n=1 Tax=Clostridium sp. FP2 TaxID=2724481 RepID=UPI0013E93A17|nr:TlpA disulfide reductase family protein [Clostridium sp. FP2]MBZ9621886.1 TlpA family protein disulfide reductase [Clostridium sp. FP2]
MKRKFLTVLILAVFCVSMVACNKSTAEKSKQTKTETKKTDTVKKDKKEVERKFEDLGIGFNLPDKWKSKGRNIDVYATLPEENIGGQVIVSLILDETMDKAKKINKDSEKIPETDKVKIKKVATELMDLTKEFKELCKIVNIDKSKTEGKVQKELFLKYKNKDLIGKEGNIEFYLLYNDKPDISGLSEKSKKAYEEIYGEINSFKSLIKTFKPVSEKEKLSKHKKVEFKTKTIDGKEIDSSIFKDSKLTMINIWATYCGPCIGEMPDLQKLYEEVKGEKINVIGLISDTPDEDNEELAKKILSKKGVKFTNIIPDESIKNSILKDVSGVPTTFFVDREGTIVGEFIVGTRGKEEYKKLIEDRLKNIK